jgi:hypothetical protein
VYLPPAVCQPPKEPQVFVTVLVAGQLKRFKNPQGYVYDSAFVVYADPNHVRYRVWPLLEQTPLVVSPTMSV